MIVVVIVDILCAILIIAGLTIVIKGARRRGGADQGHGAPSAGTYVTRIVGTMMAFFGLALSTLMTLFYFLSR